MEVEVEFLGICFLREDTSFGLDLIWWRLEICRAFGGALFGRAKFPSPDHHQDHRTEQPARKSRAHCLARAIISS
jgi:hypothetical protein